jgi:peptidylprolyl isomerase
MFKYFFKKREQKPTPHWATWLAIAVVLYALFFNKPQAPISDTEPAPATARDAIKSQLAPLENLSTRLLPSMVASLQMNDTAEGNGAPAVCGQSVTLSYRAELGKDQPIGDSRNPTTINFIAGEGRMMPALERGIIGMKPGGTREIIASPDMAYDAPGHQRSDVPAGSTVKFTLSLESVSPPMPAFNETSFRIVDTQLVSGKMLFCGNTARVHVRVMDVRGKTIFSSAERGTILEFTPGKSQVFLGLEQGVIGMTTGSERLLVVPPEFHKTMKGNAPTIDIPLPKNEIVLVEVSALP